MIKIVGNKNAFFLFFVIFCTPFLQARIAMEIRSENGIANQVFVGQPFTLEVLIDDVYGSVATPTLKGLDECVVRLVGTYMTNINGKSTTRYSYSVRIDKVGEYTIGPAVVIHQKKKLISDEVKISVVSDAGVIAQKNQHSSPAVPKAFLRLMVDNEMPFVGQKMNCCLRFYYQDSSLSLHNVGMPELSGFDIKEIGKLEGGMAEIDGVNYHYAQWRWDMYPTKPGDFIIPAYHADYDIPLKDNNHLLGGFFIFMGNRAERKRVYSNALTMKILPLPYYHQPVDAIGSFERITADIKPGVAKEGEGMVLTIELEGIGNLSAITAPKLNLPESLKYYDSHQNITLPQHADELPRKKFEFIVQAMKCGDYEIPCQLFTYFDTEKRDYITLSTSPLAVSIKPHVIRAKNEITLPQSTINNSDENNELSPIDQMGQWYPIEEYDPLPWWLFHLLFFLPCAYCAYPLLRHRFVVFTDKVTFLRKMRAIKKARKKIAACKKNNNEKDLHAIFMELVNECNSSLELCAIESFLKESGFSDELIKEWNAFLDHIIHAAYGKSNDNNTNTLCRIAQQWLDRLAKKI